MNYLTSYKSDATKKIYIFWNMLYVRNPGVFMQVSINQSISIKQSFQPYCNISTFNLYVESYVAKVNLKMLT